MVPTPNPEGCLTQLASYQTFLLQFQLFTILEKMFNPKHQCFIQGNAFQFSYKFTVIHWIKGREKPNNHINSLFLLRYMSNTMNQLCLPWLVWTKAMLTVHQKSYSWKTECRREEIICSKDLQTILVREIGNSLQAIVWFISCVIRFRRSYIVLYSVY